MFTPFERMVAFRYLRARRAEGFISVIAWFSFIGIALGVATLIIVMSVMGGFRVELLGRILGLNGHIGAFATAGNLTGYDALAQRIRAVPGVAGATPLVEGQALATGPQGGASGVLVRGMAPEQMRARRIIASNIIEGSLDAFEGDDAILVGSRLAQRFRIGPGDRLTLVSPQGTATAFGTVPRIRAYRVVATFDIGMYEYDNGFVFLPLEAAQVYFQLPDAVTQIEIFVDQPDNVRRVGRAIRDALPDAPIRLVDWTQANSAFFAAVQVERNVMFLILSLIILVAAFNIISSLIMLVKDKTRAIAVLRTMGATRGSVLRIFLMCGAAIGVIGTLLGFGLGVAFTLNIESIRQAVQSLLGTQVFQAEVYFLTRLPAVLNWTEVLQVLAMALMLSLLATIYPAWRAASLDPVEALRSE
jgi:lipoprotein-releasing system permease protein